MRTEAFKWGTEDNSTCYLPDYPIDISGAVPVILQESYYGCGGYPYTAQCFNIQTGDEAAFNLLHERAYASSVTTSDKTFIFGGNDPYDLASYETISVDHTQSEGVLPFTWAFGCATLINSTTILLAGGWQNSTTKANTWFFNWRTEEWTPGPNMIEEREDFGCGLIKSIDSVAAFGGGSLTSTATEIVKLPGGSFQKGNHQRLFD